MSNLDWKTKPRVVIVGPCASGKSTLATGLRQRAFDAAVCSQEHSEIPHLWRHTEPDVLIMLEVDLETIRARRGADWPESIYLVQQERLAAARAAANIVIDASQCSAAEVMDLAVAHLDSRMHALPEQTENG
jgi:adenylate kinase family enzyme